MGGRLEDWTTLLLLPVTLATLTRRLVNIQGEHTHPASKMFSTVGDYGDHYVQPC